MRLFAARHGQTQWNVDNKICGVTDVPLTEEGWAQARALAEKTVDLELDLVICSTILRAKQTASAVAEKLHIPVIEDPRLVEQNYGIYEGMDRKTPGFLENKRHFAVRYPGGESMMDVAHRVYGLLEELLQKYPDKRVLLICHGGVCRLIRTYFEDMTNEEFAAFGIKNCEIRRFDFK